MRQKGHPKRAPGERAGIQADAVLAAALAVYARDGLKGLTMRAVAKELDVAPNALYSHVRSKEHLVDAVIDASLGDIEILDQSIEWREALFRLMWTSRIVLLQHADLMPLFLSRATRGPTALRLGEATLRFLSRGGIRDEAAATALRILLVYTIGFAAQEAPRRDDPTNSEQLTETARIYSGAQDQPHIQALAATLAKHPDDSVFETGLNWLIDGISDAIGPVRDNDGRR
jgi:TetR/AcrR family transcriptional regulator, tetracycline repressor protein